MTTNEHRGVFDDLPCDDGADHNVQRGSSRYFCGNCGLVSTKKVPQAKTAKPGGGWAGRKQAKLLKRDGPCCHWCGVVTHEYKEPLPSGVNKRHMRTVEHLVSRRNGGGNDDANLVLACYRCNTSRGGEPESLARWAIRMTEEGHRCGNIVCQRVLSGTPIPEPPTLPELAEKLNAKYHAW